MQFKITFSNFLIISLLLLIFCSLTGGCIRNGEENINDARLITDDTGAEVTIPTHVHSVLSLAPSETEIFYSLQPENEGISLVGRTDFCNYPPEALSVPSVGGPQTLSVEAIAGLSPDLILGTTVSDKVVIDQLRSLGYSVLIFKLETIDDIFNNIKVVGDALGKSRKADNLITSMQKQIQEIKERNQAINPKKVMFVIAVDPLYVAGSDTLQDLLISISGGLNIFSEENGYFIASDEAVVNRSPDIIIITGGQDDSSLSFRNNLLQKEILSNVPAIAEDHICVVNDDIVSRPGPRITEALRQVETCITG